MDSLPVADPLDRPASPARVAVLLESAGLAPGSPGYDRVTAIAARTPSLPEWRGFLAAGLLLVGTGLVLSGIVSFFAFNWAAIGRLAKMGLVAGAMSGCALGALRAPESLVSRALLFAASVLAGALLAVFGQSYQTGADPWGLFGVWALVILPWTIAARFTPLWLLWIALVDVAYALYVAQVLASPGWDVTLLLGVAAVHVLAVAVWEVQFARTRPWLTDIWAPRALVAATLLPLVPPAVAVVAFRWTTSRAGSVALGLLAFLVVALGIVYSQARRDGFMLTAATGSAMAVVTAGIARVLIASLGVLGLFLTTGLIVAEVTMAVAWLRRQGEADA